MSNTESISAKLRRWADESKSRSMSIACIAEDEIHTGCVGVDCLECKVSLARYIADKTDSEMDELRDQFANPRYVNIEDAVREVALGIDDHGRTEDAINRYYLPRPLFEDGEPVYIGAEIDDRKRGKFEVSRICYTDGGFYFNNSRGSNGRKMKGITYKHGERVGRPKQQVLDADGVEIKVGDTVWLGREKLIVESIDGGMVKGSFPNVSPEQVQGVADIIPSDLTHREPDSQERIDGDALKSVYEYWGCVGVGCSQCPALVDGKKPKERYGVIFCSGAMHLDLLRRQRKLDGRDA